MYGERSIKNNRDVVVGTAVLRDRVVLMILTFLLWTISSCRSLGNINVIVLLSLTRKRIKAYKNRSI